MKTDNEMIEMPADRPWPRWFFISFKRRSNFSWGKILENAQVKKNYPAKAEAIFFVQIFKIVVI